MATQKQAHDWQYAHHGKRIDKDGWYGAQCMDEIIAYCVDLFGWWPKGNAKDLWTQKLPKGWKRIPNTISFRPQQGDIVVWKPAAWNGYAGHTGIETGKKPTLYHFYTMDQNWFNASATKGSPAAYVTHTYTGKYAIYGVLRPPWTVVPAPKPPAPKPKPSPKPAPQPTIDEKTLKQSEINAAAIEKNTAVLQQILDLVKLIASLFNFKK